MDLRGYSMVTPWFEELGAVPGVVWERRVELEARFVGAHPVPQARPYPDGPQVRWVDVHGRPLADEWTYRDSPVQLLLEGLYETTVTRQLALVLQALEAPGLASDYAEALGRARQVAQALEDFGLLEAILHAHVALVLAGPEAAAGGHERLDRVAAPFAALLNLYQREGFLLEAVKVEELLERLPAEARPRYLSEPGPGQLLEALRELA